MPRLSSPLASMILLLPGSSCLLLMTHYHLSGSPECRPVRPLPGWSPPTPSSATILPTSLPGPVPSSDLSCTPDAYFQLLADSSPPECVAHPTDSDSTHRTLKKPAPPCSLLLSSPSAQALRTPPSEGASICYFLSVLLGSLPLETLISCPDTRSGF